MFGKKKTKITPVEYDKIHEIPVIKCSICNGEQIAGFLNKATGKFRETVCIRNTRELEDFKESCGVTDIKKIY